MDLNHLLTTVGLRAGTGVSEFAPAIVGLVATVWAWIAAKHIVRHAHDRTVPLAPDREKIK